MLLIRPLIRANKYRVYNIHIVIFFILLVANVGGALTPLGDPPLFLGFLNGIDFLDYNSLICSNANSCGIFIIIIFLLIITL